MNKKDKIMRILWERDHTRELEQEILTGLISPSNIKEYLGRNGRLLEPNYLRAISKMFCALLLNRFMEKVIDMILEASDELDRKTASPT